MQDGAIWTPPTKSKNKGHCLVLSCPLVTWGNTLQETKTLKSWSKGKNPAIPTDNALERKLLCQKTCGTVTRHSELPGICIYRILNKEGLMERLNIKEHQRYANSEIQKRDTAWQVCPYLDYLYTKYIYIYINIEYAFSSLGCPHLNFCQQLTCQHFLLRWSVTPKISPTFPNRGSLTNTETSTCEAEKVPSHHHCLFIPSHPQASLPARLQPECRLHFYCFTWRRLLLQYLAYHWDWRYLGITGKSEFHQSSKCGHLKIANGQNWQNYVQINVDPIPSFLSLNSIAKVKVATISCDKSCFSWVP